MSLNPSMISSAALAAGTARSHHAAKADDLRGIHAEETEVELGSQGIREDRNAHRHSITIQDPHYLEGVIIGRVCT